MDDTLIWPADTLTIEDLIMDDADVDDHESEQIFAMDFDCFSTRELYEKYLPRKKARLSIAEIRTITTLQQRYRLAQVLDRLRGLIPAFNSFFHECPVQYELFDWDFFGLLYHRGEDFKAALASTFAGSLQYWDLVHQALCDEAEDLGLMDQIRKHPESEKALTQCGFAYFTDLLPETTHELVEQVKLLRRLMVDEIRSQCIKYDMHASDEEKAINDDIYHGKLVNTEAALAEAEREVRLSRAKLDDLAWEGKMEALHWSLQNRSIRRTLLQANDGVSWMADFADHPAREPYVHREIQDPPLILSSQPETEDQDRMDSGSSLNGPNGQAVPPNSPPGVQTRRFRARQTRGTHQSVP